MTTSSWPRAISIQGDQRSLPDLQLAALASRLSASSAVERQGRDILAAWDGALTADSVAGTIYTRLCETIVAGAYAAIGGPLGAVVGPGAMATRPGTWYTMRALPGVLRRAAERDNAWLPNGRTWDAILEEAWTATLRALRAEYGDDVGTWRYGCAHALTVRRPLGALPLLGHLFNRGPFPTGGDGYTVCMGLVAPQVAGPPAYIAPSYRQICDTADWDQSLSMHPTGQSGHPGSRHYADFLRPWLRLQYHPMLWSRARVEEALVDHATLT